MKKALTSVALSLAVSLAPALPALAEEEGAELEQEAELEQGVDLLQEGAKLLLRGLLQEIEPRLDELGALADEMAREIEPALRGLSEEMGPALAELLARIDSIRHYEAPEILENGDIVIRRRADAPPYVAPEADPEADPDAEPDGPIDL